MCLARDLPPPDPWEQFIYDVVWPFVDLNAKAGVGLFALVLLSTLIVGLFADLSTRERRVCGVLPLIFGVATFIGVIATGGVRWWTFRSEAQDTLLALAFSVGVLGLLVFERRLFVREG